MYSKNTLYKNIRYLQDYLDRQIQYKDFHDSYEQVGEVYNQVKQELLELAKKEQSDELLRVAHDLPLFDAFHDPLPLLDIPIYVYALAIVGLPVISGIFHYRAGYVSGFLTLFYFLITKYIEYRKKVQCLEERVHVKERLYQAEFFMQNSMS